MLASIGIVIMLIWWPAIYNMKNRQQQLVLAAIGLIIPGGAETLAAWIVLYIILRLFKFNVERNLNHDGFQDSRNSSENGR